MDDPVRAMMTRLFAGIIVAAVFTTTAVPRLRAYGAPLGMTNENDPALVAVATPALARTAPPATPTPSGQLIVYTGELIDVQRGFVFFTTGDGFRLAQSARIINYDSKQPFAQTPAPGMFAQATFDPQGQITELAIASHKLPPATTYLDIHKFAVALSTPVPNPELNPNRPMGGLQPGSRIPLTGKVVQVRFLVRVPPNTPMSDPVYLTTDVSGWNPIAIRMERIDALHYAVTLPLRTGTEFAYKYTRGSWQASERGRTGIEEPPRHFFMGASSLGEPDTALRDDIVYNWSDFNPAGGAQPVQPGAIPTPFNPQPFGFPSPFPTPTRAPAPPGPKPGPKTNK